jgi:hypothetical protein
VGFAGKTHDSAAGHLSDPIEEQHQPGHDQPQQPGIRRCHRRFVVAAPKIRSTGLDAMKGRRGLPRSCFPASAGGVTSNDGRSDLHRRRSVIVRQSQAGEQLSVVRIVNDPVA